MTTISAQVVADSVSPQGHRLTTFLLRYPRWIHAEFMTHRMFSRNAASSRAIPIEKLIKDVMDDTAHPLFWGKNQKGMQAGEEIGPVERSQARSMYLRARNDAIEQARKLIDLGLHKQVVNRLLEPFAHITVVVTATEWSNFFALRDHDAAEPHIRLLAKRMREAMNASTPKLLNPGEWHLPFITEADRREVRAWTEANRPSETACGKPERGWGIKYHDAGVPWYLEATERLKKLSVARCASTSYKTVDGFDMTMERATALYDKLAGDRPMHASPFEHQATPDEWIAGASITNGDTVLPTGRWRRQHQHGNLKGWRQLRKMMPGECL